MSIKKNYEWGKKPNEDISSKEKRKVILKERREEEDLKEQNRKDAWAILWNKRRPLSKAQKTAGAHRIL